MGGTVSDYKGAGKVDDVYSPILDTSTQEKHKHIIGKLAQMTTDDSLNALEHAKKAWNRGQGVWPLMSSEERITALQNVVNKLKEKREEIIDVLQWEICKSSVDAATEFDRTMGFIENSIEEVRIASKQSSIWKTIGGIAAKVKRAAIGIMLCLGPFNYPFNETYATMIPALLMGNVVILKLPTVGGLAHVLTMDAYASALPPGVVNFISGSGRLTVPPIMKTGDVDILAFIGGSASADRIIKDHPHPHRLKLFLQLEGKNLGIVTPTADLDVAATEAVVGTTSYNGQRCTAIKLLMVHESISTKFTENFIQKISELKSGNPWDENGKVKITPLPEPNKVEKMKDLIADAEKKGGKLINEHLGGGKVTGNLMQPAVIYPVTPDMRLWHEEQFGPVIPIATYTDLEEIYDYLAKMPYGQQASIFTKDAKSVANLVDILSNTVGRINLNTQCGRSPDTLPFSGRRSSALGTMSVSEALNQFSIETVVAAKANDNNQQVLNQLDTVSTFLKV